MVRKKLGIYQSCAIFSQINKKGKSVRIRSVDMLSIFPFFHEVAEPFTHVLFLACEQAPGEDGKKNSGERETEEFGEQSDRGWDRGACRLCF